MVSFDILLEMREFLKNGHPLSSVISAKLIVLKMKAKTVSIGVLGNKQNNKIPYLPRVNIITGYPVVLMHV